MRIRSIKYKSGTNNFIDQNQSQPHSFYERVHVMNTDTTSAKSNLNLNPKNIRKMFTQQCMNFQTQQTTESNLGQKQSESLLKDNYLGIKSQKINSKGVSLYQENKMNFDKENRTSIFQVKNKALLKAFENYSAHQNKGPKLDKIRFRLSRFSQKNEDQFNINRQKVNQVPEKDEIILGENMTYNVQSLENSVIELQQQTRKQKTKIQKIRKDLSVFGSKIQRQLDNIVRDFRKNIQSINNYMSKEKAEKCTILVNWKSVINEKTYQYQAQAELIDEISEHLQTIKNQIDGRLQDNGLVEIEDQQIQKWG